MTGQPAPLAISHFQQAKGGVMVDETVHMRRDPRIVVGAQDAFFEISVALLAYDDPAFVTYDWMIEGVDVGWNHQKGTSIRISRLPYGEHMLRIQARSGTSGPALNELAIPIQVLRPFYLTWWFIVLCAVAVAAIAYALFRYRLQQARTLFAMRDRIAMDLHDEVGSTLNSIALTACVARKRIDSDRDQSHALMGEIIANTGSTVDAMQDIVWAINSRNDELAHVVARMRAYGAKSCEARDIAFHLEVDERLGAVKLDMAQRKNVYLVFKEAISNALKYSGCRTITVGVKQHHGILVSIADDGAGFDPGVVTGNGSLGGNGLYNMRRRAEDLGGTLDLRSAPGQGTTITLDFKP